MTYRLTSAYIHPVMSWTKVATVTSRQIALDYIKDDPDPNKIWRISRPSVVPRLYVHHDNHLWELTSRKWRGVGTDWLTLYEKERLSFRLFGMAFRAMTPEITFAIGREIVLAVPSRISVPSPVMDWLRDPANSRCIFPSVLFDPWLMAAHMLTSPLTDANFALFRRHLAREGTMSVDELDRVMCATIRRHATPDRLIRALIAESKLVPVLNPTEGVG